MFFPNLLEIRADTRHAGLDLSKDMMLSSEPSLPDKPLHYPFHKDGIIRG
jgi:hypothetical protein